MTEQQLFEVILNVVGTALAFGVFLGLVLGTFGKDRWYK